MRHKYYNITVGDDPGDEERKGPFSDLQKAVAAVDSYHGSNSVELFRDMICFNGQISSVFVIWNCSDRPEYFGEVMTRLKEKK